MEHSYGRERAWSGEGPKPPWLENQNNNRDLRTPESIDSRTEELRVYLDKMDFASLRSIFVEIYEGYGADPEKMNFFQADQITGDALYALGSYSARENTLRLGMEDIKKALQKEFKGINADLLITYLMTHEQTHAVGRVRCEYSSYNLHESLEQEQVGYSFIVKNESAYTGSEWLFNDFNEGVNDLIAFEVLQKYAEVTGRFSEEELKVFFDSAEKHPYAFPRHLAKSFAQKLSRLSGVPYDTVWENVKAGLFRGDNFYQGEMREYLDELMGEEYMKNLSRGETAKTARPQRGSLEQLGRNIKATMIRLQRKFRPKQ